MPKLTILSGPSKGLSYEIQREAILGRQSDNAIPLQDSKSSRQNSRIYCRDGIYFIEDMESRNGTMLNGENVKQAPLKSGDQIKVGETSLLFQMEQAPIDPQLPGVTEKSAPPREKTEEKLTLEEILEAEKKKLSPEPPLEAEKKKPSPESPLAKKKAKSSPEIQFKAQGGKWKKKAPPKTSVPGHSFWGFLSVDFASLSWVHKLLLVFSIVLLMAIVMSVARWITLQILS